ncbi:hypothetical protein CWI38_0057p0070 [Hamiltosporidium tvaerminnensis]|uniref:Integrase catalytic domain-containing protein n=1 Tax=Hamiltosporidium tvaerminnensis TaxID=1176355 RepID=A0A4Q9M2W3_9MICR|nr:hypothetical protein CWI38_0057p0070 [Hamiltosporidium tvaerminnensis]
MISIYDGLCRSKEINDQNDQYSWILNVIDTHTKHLWCFKRINKTSKLVRDALKFLFDNLGVPVAIQSDNGREFKNTLLEAFSTDHNIKIILERPRNPKAQGERRNYSKQGEECGFNILIMLFVHITEQYIEASIIMPSIDIDPDIVLVEENAADTQWILEIASDSKIRSDQQSNEFKKYLSIGDQVLIKKNLDMNTKTKRAPSDSFYDNSVFTVTAILMNNMIEVKNNDSDTKTVFRSVIKRI